MKARRVAAAGLLAAAALLLASPAALAQEHGGAEAASFWAHLPVAWVLPFAAILLAIAILPLATPHFWESNRNKGIVVGVLALPVFGMLLLEGQRTQLLHTGLDYASFIILLGSLFVISGGVLVTGDIRATPRNNTVLLAIGGLLASLIGTTGASMLLIRPLLRINSQRKRTVHSVIFFIFVVSNVGGCLTPLGDPPLFLGFIKGVPFAWTLALWKEWAFMMAALLAIYFVVDTLHHRKEAPEDVRLDETRIEPIGVQGFLNLPLLCGVVACVAFVPGLDRGVPWRELGMVALAVLSMKTTAKPVREGNGFSFGPIVEVAVLFAGIFVAMIPALKILEARGSELGVREPWHFFWASGSLSSFLDNAPTYLTFCSVAVGLLHQMEPALRETLSGENLGGLLTIDPAKYPGPAALGVQLLTAVSLGSVFMGANSYIGNGPNFMVKAIAESQKVKMPSFFGYMAWSVGILVPLFVVVTFLFL
ncbi:MAG: sodium:proton antiporter [Planctomycetes bacterium]|nr:sodium:proton antiporter [Planctomycetota bacterium]